MERKNSLVVAVMEVVNLNAKQKEAKYYVDTKRLTI